MKKVAILGYGGRGYLYARMCKQMKNDYEVVAVIDNSQDKLNLAGKMSSLNSSQLFSSLEDFLNAPKIAEFTCKTGIVYVFALKPNGKSEFKIKSLADSMDMFHCVIKKISILGSNEKVTFSQDKKALTTKTNKINSTMPICFKIEVD